MDYDDRTNEDMQDAYEGELPPCRECDGEGYEEETIPATWYSPAARYHKCPACQGTGVDDPSYEPHIPDYDPQPYETPEYMLP